MAKKGETRAIIHLACSECRERTYTTTKNRRKHPERVEWKKYCPRCNKHTPMKVSLNKARGRSTAHTMSRGATARLRLRGERRGHGNLGKYSKPPKPKMTGKKMTKKTDLRYTCKECKKTSVQKQGIRAKRVEFV